MEKIIYNQILSAEHWKLSEWGFASFLLSPATRIWIKTHDGLTLKSVLCQYLCLHRPSLLFTDFEDIVYISDSIFRAVTFWRSPQVPEMHINFSVITPRWGTLKSEEQGLLAAVAVGETVSKISVGKQWEPAPPDLNSQNLSCVSLEYFIYKLLSSFSPIFFIPAGQTHFCKQDLCHNSSSFLMLSAFLILFNQFTS